MAKPTPTQKTLLKRMLYEGAMTYRRMVEIVPPRTPPSGKVPLRRLCRPCHAPAARGLVVLIWKR